MSGSYPTCSFFWGAKTPPLQPTIGYRGKSGLTDSLSTNVCFSNLNAPNRMSLAAPVAEISEARDANPPDVRMSKKIVSRLLDVAKGSGLMRGA